MCSLVRFFFSLFLTIPVLKVFPAVCPQTEARASNRPYIFLTLLREERDYREDLVPAISNRKILNFNLRHSGSEARCQPPLKVSWPRSAGTTVHSSGAGQHRDGKQAFCSRSTAGVQLLPRSTKPPLDRTHWQPRCRNTSGRWTSSLDSQLQGNLHRENLGLLPRGGHNPSSFTSCRVWSGSGHFGYLRQLAQTTRMYIYMAPGLGSC